MCTSTCSPVHIHCFYIQLANRGKLSLFFPFLIVPQRRTRPFALFFLSGHRQGIHHHLRSVVVPNRIHHLSPAHPSHHALAALRVLSAALRPFAAPARGAGMHCPRRGRKSGHVTLSHGADVSGWRKVNAKARLPELP